MLKTTWIFINEIKRATNTIELYELVQDAATERNYELDNSRTYRASADFFEQEALKAGNGETAMRELVEILRIADIRWYQIEARDA